MFENSLIKAVPKDIDFYEKLLYPLQDEIFSLIQTERFYLSGGTCLSRFYYNHRYSEDLDFFMMVTNFPKKTLKSRSEKLSTESVGNSKLN